MPIGLMLLLLTGIGPLLAWRKSTLVNLRDQFLFPVLSRIAGRRCRRWRLACASGAPGSASRSAASCWARSRRSSGAARASGSRRPAPISSRRSIGLVGRNKRRYGGYIVHVGIVLMFLGFAGERIQAGRDRAAHARAGGEGRRLRHPARRARGHRRRPEADGHGAHDRAARRRRAHEDVSGALVLPQARGPADDRGRDPPHVRRGPLHRDAAVRREPAVGERRDHRESAGELGLVGFGVLALGTLIALLPEAAFAFAVAKVPEAAKTATASLLLLALVLPAAVQAQDGNAWADASTRPRMQRDVEGRIICMCGSAGCVRSHARATVRCGRPATAFDAQTAQAAASTSTKGRATTTILAAFVKEYGSAVLADPDRRRLQLASPGCCRTCSPALGLVGARRDRAPLVVASGCSRRRRRGCDRRSGARRPPGR